MTPVERLSGRMPTEADIDAIARATLDRLPSPFAESLGDVVLLIEPVADAETARGLGLPPDAAERPLRRRFAQPPAASANRAFCPSGSRSFRRPILEEWQSTGVSLEQLVSHIVIHEVGHHFGFSDDDMHALEDSAE